MDTELARGYVSGALGADAQAHWESHLLTCQRCRQVVDQERAWAGLRKLDEEPPRFEGALDRVLARVEPLGKRRSRRRHLRQLGPAAGLAALLGIGLGLAYRLGTAPGPPERSGTPTSISTALERDVIPNIDVLSTLAQDPWLVDDYEAVRWLEKRVFEDQGG